MIRFVVRQLRLRAGRSMALLAGMLAATTGFIVLTGATETSRLAVTSLVERNGRAAYDVLVRPKGTRTDLEARQGLVRPNYLSGTFGGITLDQYEQVKTVQGVSVAAPIAMLGYGMVGLSGRFDITDLVDRTAARQVIRVDPTFVAERGLSRAVAKPVFVYVTRNPLAYPILASVGPRIQYTNGESWPSGQCGKDRTGTIASIEAREIFPDGHTEPVCTTGLPDADTKTRSDLDQSTMDPVRLLPDGRFERGLLGRPAGTNPADNATDRLVVELRWTVPLLLAAIDPPAENSLVGLGSASVSGRALRADDPVVDSTQDGTRRRLIPVVTAAQPYADATIEVDYSRVRPTDLAAVRTADLAATVPALSGLRLGSGSADAAGSYRNAVASDIPDPIGQLPDGDGSLETLVQPGAPAYDVLGDGSLRARPFTVDPKVYASERYIAWQVPWLASDVPFRPIRAVPMTRVGVGAPERAWRTVGMFDPAKLSGFADLGRVPLETYEPPSAVGADERSRQALGGRPLLPSGNPAGYLSSPPLALTNLAAVPKLLEGSGSPQLAAPISAIRVRVAGGGGFSKLGAERVRAVAEQIAARTGLDVDITYGSSPAPQVVEVGAGAFGRPPLRLTEGWSAKGVAARLVRAVDRKSAVLFGLVLLVCALYLANAVSAAVRDRRAELAVLSCLGWPASRIGAVILGEVAVLGLGAGLLSVACAWPLGLLLDVRISVGHAAFAVPVALLLALLAGAVPAGRAMRTHPAPALRPPVRPVRRAGRARTIAGLSLLNLVRAPGRTLLGAVALAIGVGALTVLAAVRFTFAGTVVGSVLGDAVSFQARGVDSVAAVVTVLLGAVAVADVLYLNVRDRAGELATLRATGWSDGALGRLVTYEGLGIGVLGALVGAGLGLGAAAWFAGAASTGLAVVAAATAAGGIVVTGLAALVPAVLLRRLPTARLLAEE